MPDNGPTFDLRIIARAVGRAALTVAIALFVVSALLATRTEASGTDAALQPDIATVGKSALSATPSRH